MNGLPQPVDLPQSLYSDVLERAARLAARGHYHHFRKRDAGAADPPAGSPIAEDCVPYMTHLTGVMCILARIGASEKVLAAALLHDYIEDVSDPQAHTTVEAAVGREVLDLVLEVTEDKRAEQKETDTWETRKREAIDHIAVMSSDGALLKAADLLHNLLSLVHDLENSDDVNVVWGRFNAGPDRQLWYSRSVLEALRRRLGSEHVLVRELSRAVDRVALQVPS